MRRVDIMGWEEGECDSCHRGEDECWGCQEWHPHVQMTLWIAEEKDRLPFGAVEDHGEFRLVRNLEIPRIPQFFVQFKGKPTAISCGKAFDICTRDRWLNDKWKDRLEFFTEVQRAET